MNLAQYLLCEIFRDMCKTLKTIAAQRIQQFNQASVRIMRARRGPIIPRSWRVVCAQRRHGTDSAFK